MIAQRAIGMAVDGLMSDIETALAGQAFDLVFHFLPRKRRAGALVIDEIRHLSPIFPILLYRRESHLPTLQSAAAITPCSINVLVCRCALPMILVASSINWFLVRTFLATPCSIAFKPTAAASRGNTSQSSIVGRIRSSESPLLSAQRASSSAAAMHISSVIVVAATSMTPRNIPGKPSELFT